LGLTYSLKDLGEDSDDELSHVLDAVDMIENEEYPDQTLLDSVLKILESQGDENDGDHT